jgi:hypothetical protein
VSLLSGALGLLLLLAPAVASSQCVCGFGDGRFTTHTGIVLDGDLADWAGVLADPDNNTCDGPSGGLPDRDAPVQSTGRDLTHFAFTWDNTDVYLFTERFGSANNVQRFVYYADTDNDGLLQTGERVIGVNWQGSTGLVEVYLFEYVAVAAGGDPLVDGLGFGDGYTMPGDFQNVPGQNSPTRSGNWGSPTSLQMEFRVTWAELGVAAGSPFSFHVSSSNTYFNASGYPAKVDDNLGGCGGGAGSTQFAGVTFVPDVNVAGPRGAIVFAAHDLTNTGNGNDVFDLGSAISGAHTPTVTYYLDADASGTFTPGDTALADTDGDAIPDTGVLGAGALVALLIEYQIQNNGPGDPNGVATIVTTGTSSFQIAMDDSVSDTVTVSQIPDLLVLKSVTTLSDPVLGMSNPKALPGAVMRYEIELTNEGDGAPDADTVSILDALPAALDLFVGDLGAPGSGPVQFADGTPSSNLTYSYLGLGSMIDDVEFSDDGGATFSYVPVPDAFGYDGNVTHVRVLPKGAFLAATPGGSPSFSVGLQMRVQ